MPARSVCLVTLSLSEAGPGRFGGQVSVTDIYHTMPYHTIPYQYLNAPGDIQCLCFVHMCLCLCALRACVLHVPASVPRVCVCASVSVYCRLQPRHERQHQPGHGAPRTPQAIGRPPFSLSLSLSLSLLLSLSLYLSSTPPSLHASLLPSYPLHPCNLILLDRMRSDHTRST